MNNICMSFFCQQCLLFLITFQYTFQASQNIETTSVYRHIAGIENIKVAVPLATIV
jgi:hypothetical protein